MELLKQNIEALIFSSEQSITLDEIKASLKITFGWDVTKEEIEINIGEIKNKYASEDFPFELLEIAEGYQFLTKKEYHPTVSALMTHKAKKKLSTAQMETLAIIAYKQPVSKAEIEHIRGVNCDYAVMKLLEKDLIEIKGKSDLPGKPIVYATSQSFMDYFGIKSPTDLPLLKDMKADQPSTINTIGEYVDELPEANVEVEVTEEAPVESISEIDIQAETTSESEEQTIVEELHHKRAETFKEANEEKPHENL